MLAIFGACCIGAIGYKNTRENKTCQNQALLRFARRVETVVLNCYGFRKGSGIGQNPKSLRVDQKTTECTREGKKTAYKILARVSGPPF